MNVFYVMGSGKGHLARTVAAVHTLGLDPTRVTILTSSPWATDPRVTMGMAVRRLPATTDRRTLWPLVKGVIQSSTTEAVYVDAFPVGVSGELCGIAVKVPMHYVSRYLNWPQYASRLRAEAPIYATVHQTEPMHPEQMAWVSEHAEHIVPLDLIDPPVEPNPRDVDRLQELAGERPLWLVVQSRPDVARMMAHEALSRAAAERSDAKIVLISTERPDGLDPKIGHLDAHPAYPLFPLAQRLFLIATPATYRQTRGYQGQVDILRWHSKLDDHDLREAWHAAGFTGEVFG